MDKKCVTLDQIKFGKLDAYSEYIEYGEEMYKSLFFSCPSFHVERFLDGESYYIHGDKGAGKTALLKYVQAIATEKGHLVEYIRFKKDIDEDDRNRIKRTGIPTPAYSFEEVIDSEIPNDVSIDCVLAWQIYIIKSIVLRVGAEPSGVFERNGQWDKLTALIKCAYPNETVHFKKILPQVKKGNIKLALGKNFEFGAELEWENKNESLINFTVFAKKIISMYEELTPCDKSCYLLIDELELVFLQKKKYKRDVALIRDLIRGLKYMNEISKTRKFNVHIIACIRNEVYRHVSAIGLELNKAIQDYGVEISWVQHGGSINENPLIQMLDNRLLQSQPKEVQEATTSVWDEYFDEGLYVNGRPVMNYIIDQTWNKPRDITRLFMLIQKRAEGRIKISKADFEAVRAKYSEEAWEEFSNELSVKYAREEVDAIKQVLTGITIPFDVKDFRERISKESEFFANVELLRNTRKAADILADLYQLGVIGNDGQIKRFFFKGSMTFDPLSQYTIHYPLRRFFSANRGS